MTHTIELEHGLIAYRHVKNYGDETPTLIFIHDSLGCITTWRDFPKTLAEQTVCNYLIYDRLSFGTSAEHPESRTFDKYFLDRQAERLLVLIRKLGILKPIFYGHSSGGSIALITASHCNDLATAVITEAAHVFVEPMTAIEIGNVAAEYSNGVLREKLEKHHGSKVDDVFYSWSSSWTNEKFKDWNIESTLSDISCPCLVLQGADDQYGTLEQVRRISSGVRGTVEIFILPKVGHNPHKESQALTLELAGNFINNLIK